MPRKIAGSEARKENLNMRTTASMRAKLTAAAGESGRALAHEVETRLERSFQDQEVAFAALAPKNVAFLRAVADTLERVQARLAINENGEEEEVDGVECWKQFAAAMVAFAQGLAERPAKDLLKEMQGPGTRRIWKDAAVAGLSKLLRGDLDDARHRVERGLAGSGHSAIEIVAAALSK